MMIIVLCVYARANNSVLCTGKEQVRRCGAGLLLSYRVRYTSEVGVWRAFVCCAYRECERGVL